MAGTTDEPMVSPAPDGGSIFAFDIPAEAAAPVAAGALAERAAPVACARVQVVDDVAVNRELIQTLLSPFDIEITTAENGVEAVAQMRHKPFDIVLMDVQMPVMDGLTATRLIREREAAAGASPVLLIMLTANAMEEHVAAAKAAGADLHLSKPVRPQQLLEAVARARIGRASVEMSAAV